MINKRFMPKSRDENLMVQELGGEILIYDAETNKAFCLNETSSLIWQECSGGKTVEEIAENASTKAAIEISMATVWLALDELNKKNLLKSKDFELKSFTGMSRREVIKKVGLASAVALPVVASLVSPAAIHASSLCGSVPACTPTNDGSPPASCLPLGMFDAASCTNGCCEYLTT